MLVDMVLRYMPNSDTWGPHMTRVMTIFESYVDPHFPNIGYQYKRHVFGRGDIAADAPLKGFMGAPIYKGHVCLCSPW